MPEDQSTPPNTDVSSTPAESDPSRPQTKTDRVRVGKTGGGMSAEKPKKGDKPAF